MEFIKDKNLIIKDYFHLTGNEEDSSFHYGVILQDITITKTLTISNPEYPCENYYKVTILFPSYKFQISIDIEHIDKEITEDFVKNYNIDISDETHICSVYMIPNTEFKPYELDKHTINDDLFDIYAKYYTIIQELDSKIRYTILNTKCYEDGHYLARANEIKYGVSCIHCIQTYSCSECSEIASINQRGYRGRKNICERCYICKRKIQRLVCKTCELPSCYCGHPCGCTC